MRGVFFFCFLMALPALAVAGHDIYLAFNKDDLEVIQPFLFSDVGWLWVNYAPESFDWMQKNMDPAVKQAFIDPLNEQTAILAAAVPALAVYALLFVMRLFAWWPFTEEAPIIGRTKIKKGDYTFQTMEARKKKFKYRRK